MSGLWKGTAGQKTVMKVAAGIAAIWAVGAVLIGVGCATAHATVYEIVVNANGDSDVYACDEDSPPPCVWVCDRMGNSVCGGAR